MLQPESDPSPLTALDSLVQLRATENWWAWTLNGRDYLDFLKTSLSPIITQSAPTACLRIASDYHFSSVGRGVAEHSIFGTAGETGSPDSRGKFCPQRQETISFHHIVKSWTYRTFEKNGPIKSKTIFWKELLRSGEHLLVKVFNINLVFSSEFGPWRSKGRGEPNASRRLIIFRESNINNDHRRHLGPRIETGRRNESWSPCQRFCNRHNRPLLDHLWPLPFRKENR